jgi:hypothetical protein
LDVSSPSPQGLFSLAAEAKQRGVAQIGVLRPDEDQVLAAFRQELRDCADGKRGRRPAEQATRQRAVPPVDIGALDLAAGKALSGFDDGTDVWPS